MGFFSRIGGAVKSAVTKVYSTAKSIQSSGTSSSSSSSTTPTSSSSSSQYQGPVSPSTNEAVFRSTGRSVQSSGGGSSGGSSGGGSSSSPVELGKVPVTPAEAKSVPANQRKIVTPENSSIPQQNTIANQLKRSAPSSTSNLGKVRTPLAKSTPVPVSNAPSSQAPQESVQKSSGVFGKIKSAYKWLGKNTPEYRIYAFQGIRNPLTGKDITPSVYVTGKQVSEGGKALAASANNEPDQGFFKKKVEGVKYLAGKALSYFPESYGQGAVIAGAAYGGYQVAGAGAAAYAALPTAAQRVGSVANVGATSYVAYGGTRDFFDPKAKPSEQVLGGLVAATAGTELAFKGANKLVDVKNTIGRTKIPAKNLIPEEVLSGEKRFVESSAYGYRGAASGAAKREFDIKIFKQKGSGYHAAPNPLSSDIVGKGSSEFEGLYIAPDVSPNFLKVGGEKPQITGLPKFSRPKVLQVTPEGGFVKGFSAEKGTAFVPGIKPEIEAVIPKGSKLVSQGGDYYFKYKGRVVPIDTYRAIGASESSGSNAVQILTKKFASGYSLPSSSISVIEFAPFPSALYYGTRGRGSINRQLSSLKKSQPSPIRIPRSSQRSGRSKPRAFKVPSFKLPKPSSSKSSGGASSYAISNTPPFSTPKIPSSPYGSSSSGKQGTLPKPIIKLKLKGLKKVLPQLKPQPKKYQPTLSAAALNIKAPKVPKAYLRGAGGITQRPIINVKRKSRKKK